MASENRIITAIETPEVNKYAYPSYHKKAALDAIRAVANEPDNVEPIPMNSLLGRFSRMAVGQWAKERNKPVKQAKVFLYRVASLADVLAIKGTELRLICTLTTKAWQEAEDVYEKWWRDADGATAYFKEQKRYPPAGGWTPEACMEFRKERGSGLYAEYGQAFTDELKAKLKG